MADKKATTKIGKSNVPKMTVDDLNIIGDNAKVSDKLLQIVEAAADLFQRRGYSSTTTRDIGEACNISQGHLYYYIKAKEDFLEIFRKIQESDLEKWEKVVHKLMKRLPPDEVLIETVREYISYIHMRRKLVIFWYQDIGQTNNEQRAAIMKVEAQTINLFKEIIELGCKEGQFSADDPFVLACDIHSLCIEWALKRYLLKRTCTLEYYTELCVKLVNAMVSPVSRPVRRK
jgi:TetR/AcrR family transcriptional regulator, cholesterol catabolism regulator